MKHLFSLALATGVALAALPLAASAASPAAATPGPAAPQAAQAAVPATTYRSAFAGYRPAAEDEATPDQSWRALNRKVGDAGGHMGMMKMDGHKMDGHAMPGHTMPMGHAMPKPDAKPADQPAPQHHHEGH
ncbi:hypothetical protein O0880_08395 [Janthinobacterium sp. SUN118]|uniref:hypothetical protein n=1 Tax=Janthinobacterium sp. SUN118 TaxID=3004100 RepID=UPI0025B03FAE|nr:hypothetical protein [Janthinobacterium sp. SUN118]MDN2709441.1 hypothetical protein [Janthinobacterium sp. SUN118]